MLTGLLVFVCEKSPLLRRALWRWWYNKLAKQIGAAEWVLMNYGCQLAPGEPPLKLEAADERDRLCLQLYERVVSKVSLAGSKALEIGSGRGGGASYVARYHKPQALLGIDFSREAVRFCQTRHGAVANLKFAVGNAEKLEMPDASFDAVINVESSHCYGNVRAFFGEAARVLRTGGHFLFADLREPKEMRELGEMLRSTRGFEVIEEEDITDGVVAALEFDDARKRAMIQELVPARIRPLFKEFAGLRGGQVFEGLRGGSLVYKRFVALKREV